MNSSPNALFINLSPRIEECAVCDIEIVDGRRKPETSMTTATAHQLTAPAEAPDKGVGCGELVQPSVAWEVEINYMSCIVFAATKAKAKWLAVKSYWDAYSRNGSWPHTSVARRPQYDRFPYRERKAYSPDYVRDLC